MPQILGAARLSRMLPRPPLFHLIPDKYLIRTGKNDLLMLGGAIVISSRVHGVQVGIGAQLAAPFIRRFLLLGGPVELGCVEHGASQARVGLSLFRIGRLLGQPPEVDAVGVLRRSHKVRITLFQVDRTVARRPTAGSSPGCEVLVVRGSELQAVRILRKLLWLLLRRHPREPDATRPIRSLDLLP